jgi:DNA-binding CsgD family transcriptional regulator
LQKYFGAPHGRATELPEELRDWVTHHVALAVPDKMLAAPIPTLEVVRADARLRARLLINREAKQVLLLMEEESPVSTKALEALGLTRREAEVLGWIAQGKTSPEIAALYGISTRTVQKHLEHIYQKLSVETRTAAVRHITEALKQSQ